MKNIIASSLLLVIALGFGLSSVKASDTKAPATSELKTEKKKEVATPAASNSKGSTTETKVIPKQH